MGQVFCPILFCKLKAGDTEYAGNFIYESGKLKRILIDGGISKMASIIST